MMIPPQEIPSEKNTWEHKQAFTLSFTTVSIVILLKGVWHEIFDFRFFSKIRVPLSISADKLYWRQRSVLSAKLHISGCRSRPSRYCHWNRHEQAQRHLTHPDQRPLRPTKLLQTKMGLFSGQMEKSSIRKVLIILFLGCEVNKKIKFFPSSSLKV
jgi:hypothetical protein